jgi:hypothetical protein
VKVGEIVKVKVIRVDKDQPRISLSIKALLPPPEPKSARPRRAKVHQAEPAAVPDRPVEHVDRQEKGHTPRHKERPHDGEMRRPSRFEKKRGRERGDSHQGEGRPAKGGKRPSPGPKKMDDGALHNTQLADQLAALKSKLGSS